MLHLTMSTPHDPISPSRLRSELYGSSCHEEEEPAPPLVIAVLASLLERAVARNERPGSREVGGAAASSIRAFDGPRVPDTTIQSLLERVFRHTGAGPSVYVVAYVYIDRVCQRHASLRVTRDNAHRLLVTAVMVASKFLEDLNYRNSHFAKVGGLPTGELNRLEVELLFLMGFKLHVSVSVFESYCRHLEREVSTGGGYHIERTLRSVCGGEITSKEGRRTEVEHSAEVL